MICRMFNQAKGIVMAMQTKRVLAALSLVAWVSFGSVSEAALYDRGNGLVYDNVLNLTWSKDANLFQTLSVTSGNLDGFVQKIINANNGVVANAPNAWDTPSNSGYYQLSRNDFGWGVWAGNTNTSYRNTWWGAQAFIGYLNTIQYKGYSNWQQPATYPLNGEQFDLTNSSNTDSGYGITSPLHPLAYMSIVNLENSSGSLAYAYSPPKMAFEDAANGNAQDSFINLQSGGYWSSTELSLENLYSSSTGSAFAFLYSFGIGVDEVAWKYVPSGYTWAVLPGDVASIPLPSSAWLFGSALIGVARLKPNKYRRN